MAFKAARKLFRELVRLPNRLKSNGWQEQDSLQTVLSPEFVVPRPQVEVAVGRASLLHRNVNTTHNVGLLGFLRGFSRLFWQSSEQIRVGNAVSEWHKITRLTTLFGAFGYIYLEHTESVEASHGKLGMSDALRCMQMVLKDENEKAEEHTTKAPQSLKKYLLSERLGKCSSAAAVYAANYENKQYAVKIMFNYEHASNGHALKKGFAKECRVLADPELVMDNDNWKQKSLPQHPNIIQVLHALVEETPCPADAVESYPIALPKHHFADGLGRNKTLCLIMPRYSCTLRQYIKDSNVSSKERRFLLAQLFEGVAHLVDNYEAHRDLKTDNILLDLSCGKYPKLVITDFGCCLGDEDLKLKLPFFSHHMDRGGNSALMAPEVAMAQPGWGRFIDYSKADLWASGTIAFEIFGGSNPFADGRLENRSYSEEDVERLWRYDRVVGQLINQVLQRDANKRMTADEAAVLACVIFFAPEEWWSEKDVSEEDIKIWLHRFWSQYLKRIRNSKQEGNAASAELSLQGCFLRRVSPDHLLSIVKSFKNLL